MTNYKIIPTRISDLLDEFNFFNTMRGATIPAVTTMLPCKVVNGMIRVNNDVFVRAFIALCRAIEQFNHLHTDCKLDVFDNDCGLLDLTLVEVCNG